jgi:hypothetical protein
LVRGHPYPCPFLRAKLAIAEGTPTWRRAQTRTYGVSGASAPASVRSTVGACCRRGAPRPPLLDRPE